MNQFSLIFKDQEYIIPKKKRIICAVAEEVADQLLQNNKYIVKSVVSKETFQSFLNYWQNDEVLPDILSSNFHEYEELSQEFEMMRDILTTKKDSPLFKIETLINNINFDKSVVEKEVSQNLDYYLDNFPNQMYQVPFTSLYNIFNNENRNLKSNLKAYLFIIKKLIPNDTSDPDINLYILIKTLDGSELYEESHEMFIDLISRFNEFGFLPKCSPTFIQEQIEKKNKIQQKELNDLISTGKYDELRKLILQENVTFLEIPNGITEIPNCAFFDCRTLKEVIIPPSVTKIGSFAFFRCTSLTSIFVPSTVRAIGWSAFSCCLKLKKFRVPASTTVVDRMVFDGCSSLEEIIFHPGMIEIGCCSFVNCKSLKKVTIPDSVVRILEWAFCDCSSLIEINLPPNLEKITEGSFLNCSKLEKINIPQKIQSIGSNAFKNCSSLTKIDIPPHIVSIENGTFDGCSSLTEIKLPDKLMHIKDCAFSRCTKLKNIDIQPEVTTIGNRAFNSCSSLTSINIPIGVDWIGGSSFENCCELQHVEFQTNIGAQNFCPGAFLYCPKLKEIEIAVSPQKDIRFNSFDLNTKIKINKIFT